MANDQTVLSFSKGIANVPSDATCDDNELEECVGMTFDDGEHRVIQNPVTKLTGLSGKTLLFIHKLSDADRYICRSGNEIVWGTLSNNSTAVNFNNTALLTVSGDVSVTAVGKTLVFATDDVLKYAVWNKDRYDVYDSFPEPDVEFFLLGSDDYHVATSGNPGVHFQEEHSDVPVADDQEKFNNLVVGRYSKDKEIIAQKKAFCLPFFVRTAIELYDGSFTHISCPILLLPSVSINTHVTNASFVDGEMTLLNTITYYRRLYCVNRSTINSDLCKKIVVFASRGIELYDTAVDQKWLTSGYAMVNDGIYRDSIDGSSLYHSSASASDRGVLKKRDAAEIEREIKSTSVFYKLCEIELNGDGTPHDIGEYIDTHTLENLTTQDRLLYDDYHGYCPLCAKFLYSYNGRLNLGNVSRGFFDGFGFFMPYDISEGDARDIRITVKIETDTGNRYVQKIVHNTKQIIGWWFFYPDTRATHVWMEIVTSPYDIGFFESDLKEHPGLHGAYCFCGLPTANDTNAPRGSHESFPSSLNYDPEHLSSYLLQSEVNNPFVFHAEGYFMVGDGNILGMTTQTVALSQGQFGTYPLIVFTDEGLWGLTVDHDTGLYSHAAPFSREVCNNPGSITQTDGAVFFTSKKGLMVVVGSQVRCVSEQLSGKTGGFSVGNVSVVKDMGHFGSFLEHCFIAYDYRDSLLWLFDGATHNGVKGLRYCYVYAIRSETFAKYDFGADIITSVCNDYPDYLLQSGGSAFSLTGRSDINADATEYSGTVLTRPMKFDNALALKSIRRMQNVRRFTADGAVSVRVFASNDLSVWSELQSLRCMPWKYFRLLFDFSRLKATDRFAGTVIVTQERRTNKLR